MLRAKPNWLVGYEWCPYSACMNHSKPNHPHKWKIRQLREEIRALLGAFGKKMLNYILSDPISKTQLSFNPSQLFFKEWKLTAQASVNWQLTGWAKSFFFTKNILSEKFYSTLKVMDVSMHLPLQSLPSTLCQSQAQQHWDGMQLSYRMVPP